MLNSTVPKPVTSSTTNTVQFGRVRSLTRPVSVLVQWGRKPTHQYFNRRDCADSAREIKSHNKKVEF